MHCGWDVIVRSQCIEEQGPNPNTNDNPGNGEAELAHGVVHLRLRILSENVRVLKWSDRTRPAVKPTAAKNRSLAMSVKISTLPPYTTGPAVLRRKVDVDMVVIVPAIVRPPESARPDLSPDDNVLQVEVPSAVYEPVSQVN